MAKAKVTCTCKYCSSEFVKETTKSNRREADSWESWALVNYDECPSCYGKRMREEEASKPVSASIKLDPYNKLLIIVLSGNTKLVKDELKAIGYRWGEEPMSGFFGFMSMARPRFCWQKSVSPEKIDDVEEELKSAGIKYTIDISDIDLIAYRDKLNRERKAEEERKEAISKLEKPIRPECYPAGKWNGRFYGSARSGYSIYVDGQKTTISAERKSEIEEYIEKRDRYNDAVKKIKVEIR